MRSPLRQASAAGTGALAAGAQREAPLPQEKMKILLVDDNPDNLVSTEAALEALNEELVSARSGTEALRNLLEHDFAAILLDVKMPEMDGFETAELIRSRKRSQHTPILFLTAYRNEEHLFRGYDLGAVDFLVKPIVPEILRSKVAVFVELSRSAQRQRRQAEILAKAEQKFRSLLEAAPDAMLITAADGEIVLANSRADHLFGYSRQELLGKNIRMLVPSWALSSYHVGELEAVCMDGSTFPSEISSSPLQTEEGLLVTSAIRDITERKRAEQRIAEQTQQLYEANRELRHLSSRIVAIRDEERRRLGRELHDSQGQYLAAIKMNLEMIETTDSAISNVQRTALKEASDQGQGLSAHSDSRVMGVGITGMRERVRELGGEFEIKSSTEGTIVRAVLPIGERSGANALKFESDLV